MQYHCRAGWAPDHMPVWGAKGKQTKVYYKTCPACKWWKAQGFQGKTYTESMKEAVKVSFMASGPCCGYAEIVKDE